MENPGRSLQQRKTQQIATEVLHKIESGEWSVGSALPGERRLASALGVSRNALREALVLLELTGHVQTRVGQGRYVARGGGKTSESIKEIAAASAIADSLAIREALDMSSAFLAAQQASKADLERLRAILATLQKYLNASDHRSYILGTLDLHAMISRASHNDFLYKSIRDLTDDFRKQQWLLASRYNPDIAAFSFDVHRDLVEAIATKDYRRIALTTITHYTNYPILHR